MPEITEEILRQLIPIAKAVGVDLGLAPEGSDIGDLRPTIAAVSLNRAVSEIADETGRNLKTSGLYLYKERLVVIDDAGEAKEMDDVWFRAWIDDFQINYYKRKINPDNTLGAPIKATMKADVAKVLLRSDNFRCHLPEIRKIMPVRLPVWQQEEGKPKALRLLPYGFDRETGIYTVKSDLEYELDWTLEKAVAYLRELLKDFPFADPGRSLAVQISAMLTLFCQFLFAPLDQWPMIYFNANTPGSGKSRLAEMCIFFIYGIAKSQSYVKSEEFTKKLDAWAKGGMPYLFLDNLSGLIKNEDLDRWITFSTWSGRNMHSQTDFTVLNQSIVLMTANQATLSDDLSRRSLLVDLWSSELPAERQKRMDKVIDAEWLADAPNRKAILSAMWALVSNWVNAHAAKPYEQTIPSFEGWSRIVPAIVTAAGFDCPLQPSNVDDAGGKEAVQFQRLIEAAVAWCKPEVGQPRDILLKEWCMLARCNGLFHSVVSDIEAMYEHMETARAHGLWKMVQRPPMEGDYPPNEQEKRVQAMRYMDKSMQTSFSKMLHKYYRGQVREVDGVKYMFGTRSAKYSGFTLARLEDKPAA